MDRSRRNRHGRRGRAGQRGRTAKNGGFELPVRLYAFTALAPVTNGSVPRALVLLIGTNLGPPVVLWG